MKTVFLKVKAGLAALVLFFAGAQTVSATGFLSIDADARYVNTDFARDAFMLKTLGVVARKVIADADADRWVLYGQLEVTDDFTNTDFHQLYAMFKGPMGRWNLSAGRVRLPYGLLTNYSTDHTPFAALDHYTLGIESDNGIQAAGTLDRFSYSLTVTRGAGIFRRFPGSGLLTGRAGMTLGESDEFSVGLSGAAGRTGISHPGSADEKRLKTGAVDFTGQAGQTSFRAEFSAGKQMDDVQIAAFAGADYTALPWLEFNVAASAVREAAVFHHLWGFIGTTFNTSYLTLKGGYKYVHYGPVDHQVTLMAYKQFAFNF